MAVPRQVSAFRFRHGPGRKQELAHARAFSRELARNWSAATQRLFSRVLLSATFSDGAFHLTSTICAALGFISAERRKPSDTEGRHQMCAVFEADSRRCQGRVLSGGAGG